MKMVKLAASFASFGVFVALGNLATAQSATLREELLKKAQEIYREAAPTKLTFVTVSKEDVKSFKMSQYKMTKSKGGAASAKIDGFEDSHAVQVRATRIGESGTGVILDSKDDQVYLDANPCNGRIMVFTEPYRKDPAGVATCKGTTVEQFKFVQK